MVVALPSATNVTKADIAAAKRCHLPINGFLEEIERTTAIAQELCIVTKKNFECSLMQIIYCHSY